MATPKKPLIDSGPVSEFGVSDPTMDLADAGMPLNQDLMYVPGFSDLRQQREGEMVEYKQGTIAGKDVSSLPANVYWARRTNLSGKIDPIKLMGAKNAGYRPVTKDDIGSAWLTGMGAGWTLGPDNQIINAAGDLQLMVLEGQAAANRARRKEKTWLDQSGSIQKAEKQTGDPGGKEITNRDGTASIVDKVTSAPANPTR